MSSSYRLSLDRFLQSLDVEAGIVIDLGGAQLPVKGRTRTWNVGSYFIYDLENPHTDAPKPDVVFNLEYWQPTDSEADIVFCLEVFDYIVDPVVAMENICGLLRPGGLAYVSFPMVYPTHQPLEHEGLRYTENAIRRLAKMAELDLIETIPRRPETDLLDRFYRAERMRAAKGYDHQVTGWICTFQRPL